MAYLIKVALPDIDVKAATPEQCAIHSGYNAPKIDALRENFLNIPIFFINEPPNPGLGSTLETILQRYPHGYNYQPQLWLHADYTSRYGPTSTQQFGPGEAFLASPSVNNAAYVGARADRTNYYVYIRKESATAPVSVQGMSITLRLYIFADLAFE